VPGRRRVLFIFAWLVVGGEETEVRLLARHLDPARYHVEVIACLRRAGMPTQTHDQLTALGVPLDTAPYARSFADTVAYLAEKIPAYDLVVACQAVPDVYPALELIPPGRRPPLIEHGGLVAEALAGPKHRTARYVGVCRSIRDAAAARMPGRPQHALEIPSMVDLDDFDPAQRGAVRRELGVLEGTPLIGWVGRLDRKKRVEDFLRAAALVRRSCPRARFVVVGGPDAFMPEYAAELRALATTLELDDALRFLGDRPDVPRLLAGLDVFVWLSRGEGMPHVVAEAGAAGLPVVATRDNGTEEQLEDGVSGLFVPHEAPDAAAGAIRRLLDDPSLARRLGRTLRRTVEREYSAAVVTRRWEALFDEVVAESVGTTPRRA
jgi:polysaccharide biosynthesis protein PelF